MANAPASMLSTKDNGTIYLKKGITIEFAYSGTQPNRLLTLTVTGITLTQQQINKAQTALDTKFGINQVVVNNQP